MIAQVSEDICHPKPRFFRIGDIGGQFPKRNKKTS